MVLTLQGMNLALGMEWQWLGQADGDQRVLWRIHQRVHQRVLKNVLKRHPQMSAVAYTHQGDVWVGLHPPVQTKVHAGALVLGLLYPLGIVSVDLGQGAFWLCALKGGLPVVGFDTVVSAQDTEPTLKSWLESLEGWPRIRLSWHAGGAGVHVQGEAVEGSLNHLLLGLKAMHKSHALTGQPWQSFVLSKKRESIGTELMPMFMPWSRLALWLTLALIGLVAFFLWGQGRWEWFTQAQVLRDAAHARLQGLAQLAQLEQQQAEAERQWLSNVKEQKDQLLRQPEPWALWSAFDHIRHALPLSLAGYRVSRIACTLDDCVVSWVGEGVNSRTQDQLKLPFVQKPLRADLQASSRLVLNLPIVATTARADSMTLADWLLYSKGDFARHHLGFTVEDPRAILAPPRPPLASPLGSGTPTETLAHRGAWRMHFAAKTHLLDAAQFAQLLQSHSLLLTTIDYAPQQSIEMRGEYLFVQP